MSAKYAGVSAAVLFGVALQVSAAYTNLNFESATIVPSPDYPPIVFFAPAFPGWTGMAGTNVLSIAAYDALALDSANISILDSSYSTHLPFQGTYTALLQAGSWGNPGADVDVSISQTGFVPSTAKSISFLANASGQFSVSLGGVGLSLIPSNVPNQSYTLYRADISAFAGQTQELTFTALKGATHSDNGLLLLDSIQFSSVVVPEPSTFMLVAASIAVILPLSRPR